MSSDVDMFILCGDLNSRLGALNDSTAVVDHIVIPQEQFNQFTLFNVQ